MNLKAMWPFLVFVSATMTQARALAWDYLDPRTGQQFEISSGSENTYLFVSADCYGCYQALSILSTCTKEKLKYLKVISLDSDTKSKKLWIRAGPQTQTYVINLNRSPSIQRKYKVNGTPFFIGPQKGGLGSPECKDLGS